MDAAKTVIVLTGGSAESASSVGPLPHAAMVIAADSGLELAGGLGLDVDLVIGDMDSIDDGALAAAIAAGVPVDRHPADKDQTDLELALSAATRDGGTRIILVGGSGGRLDHLLGNALALTAATLAGIAVEWRTGPYRAVVVRTTATLDGAPGDVVSLLPLGGAATAVTTTGLRWPLAGETLDHGSGRGMSNEMTADTATVAIGSGTLLAIHEKSQR